MFARVHHKLQKAIFTHKLFKLTKYFIYFALVVICCTGCSKSTYDLTITASTPYLELMEALARQFQKEQGIIVSVKGTLGQEELLINKNLTDIILVDKELESPNLQVVHFASEQTRLIINTENKLKSITQEQLENIYQGKITSWQEIKASSLEDNIQLLTREPSSGIKNSFLRYYLPHTEYISLMALTVNTNTEMQSAVANMKNSIGYASTGALDSSNNSRLKPISVLNAKGQVIKIPETKIYYIYSKKNSNEYISRFIEFMKNSPQAKQLIQQRGLIVYN